MTHRLCARRSDTAACLGNRRAALETGGFTVLSCHACPTREWASDALLWQRTPQPPSFNAAGGLASGERLAHVGHVAAPDPGVGGHAHRGTWRLRTPARAGSGGPEVRAYATRGGTGPGGRRPRPQGHVAAPDPCPSEERRSRGLRLASLMTQASWRSGFHL